ncbi:hypothetical protein Hanom_Chr13g01217441 [Helianthus anomalus]
MGVKRKFQASEDTLTEEHRKWREACKRDNERMYSTRTEIANLKAQVEAHTKSKADFEERYEVTKSHRKCAEILQVFIVSICAKQITETERLNKLLIVHVELEEQLVSKDRYMVGKDVEIVELKCRLRESEKELEGEKQKAESLEIDLEAERLKSESAEEARKFIQAAIDVAQDKYAEVQATVEPFVNYLEWLQQYGIVHVANLVLNSIELDRAVATHTITPFNVGHCDGYTECASDDEVALHVQWGTRNCSVNEGAEKGLRQDEENYDNLSLPVKDLVSDALKHDDYVMHLKAIFEVPEAQELFDGDDDDAGDGKAK